MVNLGKKVDVARSRLNINIAVSLNGSYYLMVVDRFSKYPEIVKRKKARFLTVIKYY